MSYYDQIAGAEVPHPDDGQASTPRSIASTRPRVASGRWARRCADAARSHAVAPGRTGGGGAPFTVRVPAAAWNPPRGPLATNRSSRRSRCRVRPGPCTGAVPRSCPGSTSWSGATGPARSVAGDGVGADGAVAPGVEIQPTVFEGDGCGLGRAWAPGSKAMTRQVPVSPSFILPVQRTYGAGLASACLCTVPGRR